MISVATRKTRSFRTGISSASAAHKTAATRPMATILLVNVGALTIAASVHDRLTRDTAWPYDQGHEENDEGNGFRPTISVWNVIGDHRLRKGQEKSSDHRAKDATHAAKD